MPKRPTILDRARAKLAAQRPTETAVKNSKPSDRGKPAATAPEVRGRWEPDLVCLADVEPQAVPWLWPGRIPIGRITLLVGRPGAGKSFLTCDLAARVSTHAHWPDPGLDRAPLGDTLLISAEDDPADTIRPRLDAAGADCRRVHMLRAAKILETDGNERSVAFSLANADLIRDALDRLPECKLVIVDPIGSYLGGQADANRDNEVRSVLAPLAAIAAERGVAAVLVCHTRKALSSFADDVVLGSRAFVGLARSVLHLMADPDDEKRKLLLPGKCNLADPSPGLAFRIIGDPARLEWEPDPLDGIRADEIVANGSHNRPGPEGESLNEAMDWLRATLADGPRPAKELFDEWCNGLGSSKRTLDRAKRSLQIVAYRPEVPGPWWWRLPDKVAKISQQPGDLGNLGNLAKNKGNLMVFDPGQPKVAKIAKFSQQLGNLGPEDADSPPEDTADDSLEL
jgi:hypothetical protein